MSKCDNKYDDDDDYNGKVFFIHKFAIINITDFTHRNKLLVFFKEPPSDEIFRHN